jgi:predicted NAD-dependent protein-ADP-ribosyltransferase YbiA (DUF1768 family)
MEQEIRRLGRRLTEVHRQPVCDWETIRDLLVLLSQRLPEAATVLGQQDATVARVLHTIRRTSTDPKLVELATALSPPIAKPRAVRSGSMAAAAAAAAAAVAAAEHSTDSRTRLPYDSSVVLQFYSKSKHEPKPGRGAGETIPAAREADFEALAQLPQWRATLSNFSHHEFELDGLHWHSVEHYYQGSKFKEDNPAFARLFALESDSVWCRDALQAKKAGGKSGKPHRPAAIKADRTFFTTARVTTEMHRAHTAKFEQNAACREVLMATRDAKLVHFSRGQPPIVFSGLCELRNAWVTSEQQ